MSDTDLYQRTVHSTDNGEHDMFAHYVDKTDAVRSAVEGTPIMALCGKIWIPTRAPERYPICPTCKEIYEEMF
jgi:hypothetical protein